MIRHYLFPVVGIILGFSACRSSETNEKQVLMVKTETVKNYENELQVTYPGRVKAAADVDLAFRVAGPIIRIPVQVGSFVRKGEVIAEIDPRDYELQYKATEAEYKQIKSEAERVIELYNRKSVPENDYDKAVYGSALHGIYHLVCQLQYLVMGKTTDNLSMLYLHRRLALFGNLYDFREVFPAFRILINILATRITGRVGDEHTLFIHCISQRRNDAVGGKQNRSVEGSEFFTLFPPGIAIVAYKMRIFLESRIIVGRQHFTMCIDVYPRTFCLSQ